MNQRTPLYRWEDETETEHPSEFASTSAPGSGTARSVRSSRELAIARSGLWRLAVVSTGFVGFGAWALYRFAPLLAG